MGNAIFVAVISGKKVYGGFTIVGVIDTLDDAHKVLDKTEETLGIKFVKDEYYSNHHYHVYRNNTDDGDIMLTIELAHKL